MEDATSSLKVKQTMKKPGYLVKGGISVAGRRLTIDPKEFMRKGDSGRTIIDSGSAFTYLVPEAYNELARVLIEYPK